MHGAAAMLVLLGSIGLIVHAHEALPELAALAALCGALATLPHAARRPLAAGVAVRRRARLRRALGEPGSRPLRCSLAVVAAHLACREWRTRNAASSSSPSLCCVALADRRELAARARLARARSCSSCGARVAWQPLGEPLANLRYFLVTGELVRLAGVAARALGARGRCAGAGASRALFVPAAATRVDARRSRRTGGRRRTCNLIPLLAPLALLAAQGALVLRRGAAGALDWFGVLGFGFFGAADLVLLRSRC